MIYDALYRQSEKEQGQLQLQYFVRNETNSALANLISTQTFISRTDSLFVVGGVAIKADPGAAQAVINYRIHYRNVPADAGAFEFELAGGFSLEPASGRTNDEDFFFFCPPSLIIPGGSEIVCTVGFTGLVNSNRVDTTINGFLIPRGMTSI